MHFNVARDAKEEIKWVNKFLFFLQRLPSTSSFKPSPDVPKMLKTTQSIDRNQSNLELEPIIPEKYIVKTNSFTGTNCS